MDLYLKCANYASSTCPCVLAEAGCCIVCSMCRGENYCTCSDTVSFCVMQELKNNLGKAKKQNDVLECKVTYEKTYDDIYKFIRVKIPTQNVSIYKTIGSFVFLRTSDYVFYDVPISVLYEDYDNDDIGLLIQIRGIKTECFRNLHVGDSVFLRGPFHNGIQGIKNIAYQKDGNAMVICRGLGFIPSLHAIHTLIKNNNKVDIYVDRGQFSDHILEMFSNLFEVKFNEITICEADGSLTEKMCGILNEFISKREGLIHFGLSDFLLKKAIEFVDNNDKEENIKMSCINNARMSCGEGICGACAKDLTANKVVHLCKEQIDLREYKNII